MKQKSFIFFSLLMVGTTSFAQVDEGYRMRDYHPSTPNTYQIDKYTEVPVSEYTGVPQIGVPIYTIDVDGIKVPLNLQYHAGGIKVSEESSWVGLGWDMASPGSIVQTINDIDDDQQVSQQSSITVQRLIPDFRETYPMPAGYPQRFCYPNIGNNGDGWSNPYPVNPTLSHYSYVVATDEYMPVGGTFNTRYPSVFENNGTVSDWGDTEPDIYTANFSGHSLRFVKEGWVKNGVCNLTANYVVLNKKGYKIVKNTDGTWTIIVPSGEEYHFDVKTVTTSFSSNSLGYGSQDVKCNNIWMLTKIVTKNKENIVFNYSASARTESFINYSQKWNNYVQTGSFYNNGAIGGGCNTGLGANYYNGELENWNNTNAGINYINGITSTTAFTKQEYFTLSGITYRNYSINFYTSSRTDLKNGLKLDSLKVFNTTAVNSLPLSYRFNYAYFTTTGNINGHPFSSTYTDANASLRLKLLSVQLANNASYSFTYDETPLPWKNSFAQDFWGYYNGKSTNTSLIPNPIRFNRPELGDNGNNHSAYLSFTQAGVLKTITYPTGGSTTFEYELNKFNNYWVPDMAATTNTISSGNGLRIAAMYFYTGPNILATQTYYNYCIGKAIHPLNIFRQYAVTRNVVTTAPSSTDPNGGQTQFSTNVQTTKYLLTEVNVNGFFSTNMLGSGSGVGYDTVIRKEGNGTGLNGRTMTTYFNNPDVVPDVTMGSLNSGSRNISLPASKYFDPAGENGSVKSIFYYDDQGILKKRINNTYANNQSDFFMGARTFGYSPTLMVMPGIYSTTTLRKDMIGFYPIYDFECLLNKAETIDYLDASLTNSATYSYDQYSQVSNINKTASYYNKSIGFKYPYSISPATPVLTAMINNNRLSDIVSMSTYTYNGTPIYRYDKTFVQQSDKFLESKVEVYAPAGSTLTARTTTYDLYNSDNSNLQQFTALNTPHSLVWDYNGEHVVAEVKDAPYNEVAYTSFEGAPYTTSSNGISNGWAFSSNNINAFGITGNHCLALTYTAGTGPQSVCSYGRTLTPGQNYILSFWVKGTYGVTIKSGSLSQSYIPLRTLNEWAYYEINLLGSGQSLSIQGKEGTGQMSFVTYLDEVRLCPVNASMQTYTYSPFGTITSSSDQKGSISYYEYDNTGKLINIRDEQNNIIKNADYKLSTQQ